MYCRYHTYSRIEFNLMRFLSSLHVRHVSNGTNSTRYITNGRIRALTYLQVLRTYRLYGTVRIISFDLRYLYRTVGIAGLLYDVPYVLYFPMLQKVHVMPGNGTTSMDLIVPCRKYEYCTTGMSRYGYYCGP